MLFHLRADVTTAIRKLVVPGFSYEYQLAAQRPVRMSYMRPRLAHSLDYRQSWRKPSWGVAGHPARGPFAGRFSAGLSPLTFEEAASKIFHYRGDLALQVSLSAFAYEDSPMKTWRRGPGCACARSSRSASSPAAGIATRQSGRDTSPQCSSMNPAKIPTADAAANRDR